MPNCHLAARQNPCGIVGMLSTHIVHNVLDDLTIRQYVAGVRHSDPKILEKKPLMLSTRSLGLNFWVI